MRTTRRFAAFLAVLAACLQGPTATAQQPASAAEEVGSHETTDHGVSLDGSDTSSDYLTLNVAVSDTAIQPSALFVPAGRPVQLMLRNRSAGEHHYHVVDLVPDDLAWAVERNAGAAAAGAAPGAAESHDHHARQLVRARPPSPAGITPTGTDVHAYVSASRGMDTVLFTATRPGTYTVRCDLHPGKFATLTVFDAAGGASVPAASVRRRQALALALGKRLGPVEYPGAPGVDVDITYATPDYVAQALGGPAALNAFEPERHVVFLLTERVHTSNLPHARPPNLFVNGEPVSLVDHRVVTSSPHHRATLYRFTRDDTFGNGHQMMTLRLATGQEATWHLPIVLPESDDAVASAGAGEGWGLILALLGGMLAAMWPCLFQLTVYFIPALAGVAMQDAHASTGARRRQVLQAAFYFILGFTILYTATGALIGFAAQQMGDTAQFEVWQRYFGVAAGVVVIGLAVRVAAKARAPLVCRMPVLAGLGRSNKPASRFEMMVAGLAFATGCMTCFGSALVVGMVVYVGLAQSAFYGALVLFLFSLGMGVPLVIAAVTMARALPLLMKLETVVPWMGLASAVIMAGFGVLLLSGNYMMVAEWSQRVVSDGPSSPFFAGARLVLGVAIVATVALVLMAIAGKARRSQLS